MKHNEEFVADLMKFSPYGALQQAFIIEAIRYYAEKVAATPEPKDDATQFINPSIWHKIAIDIQERLKKQYEH
jgi:hypothetical protein